MTRRHRHLISSTRIYAALAVRSLYLEECDDCVVALAFYANAASYWFYTIDHKMKSGDYNRWWSNAAFLRIVEKTETTVNNIGKMQAAE